MMKFQRFYLDAFLKRLFYFKGRVSRSEYWYFICCHIPIMMALGLMRFLGLSLLIGSAVGTIITNFLTGFIPGASNVLTVLRVFTGVIGLICFFLLLVTIFLSWALTPISVRRFHDINRSGWWCLSFLFPPLALILLLQEGDTHDNQFGPPPRQDAESDEACEMVSGLPSINIAWSSAKTQMIMIVVGVALFIGVGVYLITHVTLSFPSPTVWASDNFPCRVGTWQGPTHTPVIKLGLPSDDQVNGKLGELGFNVTSLRLVSVRETKNGSNTVQVILYEVKGVFKDSFYRVPHVRVTSPDPQLNSIAGIVEFSPALPIGEELVMNEMQMVSGPSGETDFIWRLMRNTQVNAAMFDALPLPRDVMPKKQIDKIAQEIQCTKTALLKEYGNIQDTLKQEKAQLYSSIPPLPPRPELLPVPNGTPIQGGGLVGGLIDAVVSSSVSQQQQEAIQTNNSRMVAWNSEVQRINQLRQQAEAKLQSRQSELINDLIQRIRRNHNRFPLD